MILDINTTFESYTIRKFIGANAGGYREIYKAVDTSGKDVEIAIYISSALPGAALADLPAREIELRRKLRSQMLPRHIADGVANVYGEDMVYVVSAWRERTSLHEMAKMSVFSDDNVYEIFYNIALAVTSIYILTKNGIHANFHPGNIFIDTRNFLFVDGLEFVIPSSADTSGIDMSQIDVAYRAPETHFRPFSQMSMQYTLAAILAFLFTEKHPYGLTSDMTTAEACTKLRKTAPNLSCVPDGIRAVLAKALNIDPKLRYKTLSDFLESVMNIADIPYPEVFDYYRQASAPNSKTNARPGKDADDKEASRTDDGAPLTVEFKAFKGDGLKSVAGMDQLKSELKQDFVEVVNNPELAKAYNLGINGLLLYGVPGCGKSFIAECLAQELGVECSIVKPSDLGSTFIHGSQIMIKKLFEKAEKCAKANGKGTLLIFDEFDAMCPQRSANASDHQSNEVAEFLTQLNNASSRGIMVIATTNYPERIDRAVMRSGRFDKTFFVGLPDAEARRELFRLELKARPAASKINYKRLSQLTEGFTASDIRFIVSESARRSFHTAVRGKDGKVVKITQSVIEKVIAESSPSVSSTELGRYESMRLQLDIRNASRGRRTVGFDI